MRSSLILTLTLLFPILLVAQINNEKPRWELDQSGGILWDVKKNPHFPHQDHMAMSGLQVDMILEWQLDTNGYFQAERVIRWPMLRTLPDDTHASLQRRINDEGAPSVLIDGEPYSKLKVQSIQINGYLSVQGYWKEDLEVRLHIFPSLHSPVIFDQYEIINRGKEAVQVQVPAWSKQEKTASGKGQWGAYLIDEFLIGEGSYWLAPGQSLTYSLVRTARKEKDAPYFGYVSAELLARQHFIQKCSDYLVLETPDAYLNQLFRFSKIRATESIFSTRGGLMHGPGGYNKYLAAIWANDQAEYVNPFFPFLGNPAGNESAMNSFRHFARYINPEYKPIPSSIIAEGRSFWNGAGDRGDMAMIAYGAARFALASGNKAWSEELWPLIEWCLEYNDRQKMPSGVIASDTDELEGRFPAGEANLSTSSLYYDALRSAASLGRDLGKAPSQIDRYQKQARNLRQAIKDYFEAEVEGFETYQYYKGNDILRSWICIPLTVDIYDRLEGTIQALFSDRLWTKSGLLTKAGTTTVWDRSTLYALRGVMAGGAVDKGMEKLIAFSKNRLLGDHVPYVIEAYPEYNQSHLSAESGLYCRIFTEGVFGIRPTGLNAFSCTPRLPESWDRMALKNIQAFGRSWDVEVTRAGERIRTRITDASGEVLYDEVLGDGEVHFINL
jgi:hypothetical protein